MGSIGNHLATELQPDRAVTITPSDGANLERVVFGIYIGTGGNLRVTTQGGDDVIYYNVQDGTYLPISAQKVWSTSTTATNIIGHWDTP